MSARPIDTHATSAESAPEPPVLYGVSGGVATIRLNRPASSNALDLQMADALVGGVEAASADPAVRAVLLLGTGKLFCAGGDVTGMAAAGDRGEFVHELATAAHRAVRALAALDKPVVAGVQGAAAGAGLALVLWADLVVAGRSASFLTAYTAIGLTPDCGLSWLLPQAIGLNRAVHMTLTNRRLSAAEAVEYGLISSVCDDDEVAATAAALASRMAAGPPQALGWSRGLLRSAVGRTLDEHLDLEAETIAAAGRTPEAEALIDAFVRGRSRLTSPSAHRSSGRGSSAAGG